MDFHIAHSATPFHKQNHLLSSNDFIPSKKKPNKPGTKPRTGRKPFPSSFQAAESLAPCPGVAEGCGQEKCRLDADQPFGIEGRRWVVVSKGVLKHGSFKAFLGSFRLSSGGSDGEFLEDWWWSRGRLRGVMSVESLLCPFQKNSSIPFRKQKRK